MVMPNDCCHVCGNPVGFRGVECDGYVYCERCARRFIRVCKNCGLPFDIRESNSEKYCQYCPAWAR